MCKSHGELHKGIVYTKKYWKLRYDAKCLIFYIYIYIYIKELCNSTYHCKRGLKKKIYQHKKYDIC